MNLDTIHILVVGVLLVAGLVSVIVTLPKVPKWWKPAYWMAIPMNALLCFMYWDVAVARVLGVSRLAPTQVGLMLRISLALLALELILVPYIHRLESRRLRNGGS